MAGIDLWQRKHLSLYLEKLRLPRKNNLVKKAYLVAMILLMSAASLSQTSPDGKEYFIADGRISAQMPDHAELGQPIQIPFVFTDANIKKLLVYQQDNHHELENKRAGQDVSMGRVVRDSGLIKIVEIIPLGLGTITVHTMAIFADGGISQSDSKLRVVPSSKGLKHFYLNQGSSAWAIVLEEEPERRRSWISPEVYYEDLDYPIYLPDSTMLKFTVVQPTDRPVIRLEPNGTMYGLRPGKAKITADFDGVIDILNVTVYDRHRAPIGYAINHCEAETYRIFKTPMSGSMSKAEIATRAEQKKELRTFLWSNWVGHHKACVSDLIYNKKGDSTQTGFAFEPDDNGVWSVYGNWSKYRNWQPSNGEFRAYTLQRKIRRGNQSRTLKDDEEHGAGDYVLLFKDAQGKIVLSF